MSTRARIAVRVSRDTKVFKREVKAGQIIHVYSHSDGYPSGKIPTLTEHYNTEEKAIEMIANGDISCLYESCEKPEGHTFDNPVEGHTVYFGRDRGEEKTEFAIGDWDSAKNYEEYSYLFENGSWRWTCEYYKNLEELKEDEEAMQYKDSFVEQV